MKDQDSIFFRNFSILVGTMFAITIVLAAVGYSMNGKIYAGKQEEKERMSIEEALKPVAKVNTGEIEQQSTEPEAVTEQAPAVAFDGSLDGEMIYQNVCFACHGTGAAGAPKLVADDWTDRMDKGIDGLVTSAANGLNAMPPRGGRPDLSDEQLKVTIEFMTKGF